MHYATFMNNVRFYVKYLINQQRKKYTCILTGKKVIRGTSKSESSYYFIFTLFTKAVLGGRYSEDVLFYFLFESPNLQ